MNHQVRNQIGLEKLSRYHGNIQTDYHILNAKKSFYKWEVEIVADNS